MVPGPRTSARSPGARAAPAPTQRVAAGLHERAEHGVDRVGKDVQRRGRYGQLLGQRAGTAPADANLLPVLTDVLVAPSAAATGAVAEHGVAHDPATDPCRVHAVTDAGTVPAHSCPRRIGYAASPVKVGHLAGEELHVGAADADALHLDDDLARGRDRGRHLLHLAASGAVRTYARIVRAVTAAIISFARSRSPAPRPPEPPPLGRIHDFVERPLLEAGCGVPSGTPVMTATPISTGPGCAAGCPTTRSTADRNRDRQHGLRPNTVQRPSDRGSRGGEERCLRGWRHPAGAAGGIARRDPARPTAMLWRNMAAMATEEMLRANPIDGVVLSAAATRPSRP